MSDVRQGIMLVSKRRLILPSRLSAFLCAILFFAGSCRQNPKSRPAVNEATPGVILWAWERPEDLRFLDANRFGVAFLAQTLLLKNDEVIRQPRRQPLQIAPNAYLIAVTRIETDKRNPSPTNLSDERKKTVVSLIKKTLELPNVKAVQIDFDASVSERDFYRRVVRELKNDLPANTPLTMTALASWCVGDAWFADLPIDEAVPMVFEMGADDKAIRDFLASGNDWREPLCRGSYGVAVDEPLKVDFRPDRRFFYFKSRAWDETDLEKLD